ncbi:MAG: patatin family protein [Proteobacteria bacterium]|nr:patatin family protein [Pseudomonadota bacterium]
MRGIFSCGVLNAFGKAGFDPFDLYIGVSAGACNLASHIAGQNERNLYIFEHYSTTPHFINFLKFLKGGHLIDLDWLWDITIKEYRLDLDTIFSRQNKEFIIVVTSVETGEPVYLKPDKGTLEHYLKVSSALPVFYRENLFVNNDRMTDGGIADSIPVIEAYRRGARDIMVVRSRHTDHISDNTFMTFMGSLALKDCPSLVNAMKNRADAYKKAIQFIHHPPDDVKIMEVIPPKTFETRRLTRNIDILLKDFELGREIGFQAISTYSSSHMN